MKLDCKSFMGYPLFNTFDYEKKSERHQISFEDHKIKTFDIIN